MNDGAYNDGACNAGACNAGAYSDDAKTAEVLRLLDRYLVEIVEAYGLCPWAHVARTSGEVAVEVLWGAPDAPAFVDAAQRALAQPAARVAMIVAPELAITPSAFSAIRNEVSAAFAPRARKQVTTAGVADFHPDSKLDLATPARLVPFVRRSPDPMLQLVPLAILDAVRGPSSTADRMHQVNALADVAPPPRVDVADRIADTNHAVVSAELATIQQRLADIADDRRVSYARVGIRSVPAPSASR